MAQQLADITGQRFGRFTVIRRIPDPRRTARWLCVCDCGNERVVVGTSLRNGISRSCGCLRSEMSAERAKVIMTRHGFFGTREYRIWQMMKYRCLNPKSRDFKRYSPLGMDECWIKDVTAFIEHVGRRPSDQHSIDRIDNERGYFPGNVRWATPKEQAANKRSKS